MSKNVIKDTESLRIKAVIRKYKYISDIDHSELAAALCMSISTLYSRLRNPCDFTIGEALILCKKLNIPFGELLGQKTA